MRLKSANCAHEIEELTMFANWIIDIGKGRLDDESTGQSNVHILDDLLIKDFDDPVSSIIKSTYPPS